ncbi:MAG: hypothetical protein ACK4GN_18760, partial [Runella sp.]
PFKMDKNANISLSKTYTQLKKLGRVNAINAFLVYQDSQKQHEQLIAALKETIQVQKETIESQKEALNLQKNQIQMLKEELKTLKENQ